MSFYDIYDGHKISKKYGGSKGTHWNTEKWTDKPNFQDMCGGKGMRGLTVLGNGEY